MYDFLKMRGQAIGAHTSAKRISNRAIRRMALAEIDKSQATMKVLLAVLAQSGGEVIITPGTIDQVGQEFEQLGFEVVPVFKEGKIAEFKVHMTNGRDEISVAGTFDMGSAAEDAGKEYTVEKVSTDIIERLA